MSAPIYKLDKETRGILNSVKDAIRNPFAWPGGYPIYTTLSDGMGLCPKCARENYRLIAEHTRDRYDASGWRSLGAYVYWEGPTLDCANCGANVIESAYGDPNEGQS